MPPTIPSTSPLQSSREQRVVTRDFELENGQVLPEMQVAYLTLGTLAADGRNAILLTHGYSSSHRLSKASSAEASEGGWNLLVGPGRPIDTRRYFVISSNMLGSSYGSTGPASINPATGHPYGGSFPEITFHDIVRAQRALTDHLGVRHLHAIVGASYGGFQAFQWAVDYPSMVGGVVAAMTSLWAPEDGNTVEGLTQRLAMDPHWNNGDFYKGAGVTTTMTELRIDMLRQYGAEAGLAAKGVAREDMPGALRDMALPWAQQFDPHSLIVLLRAAKRLTLGDNLGSIRAKVLYLLSSTDRLFPPSLGPVVMQALNQAGVSAAYSLLDSDRGHRASHEDAGKWAHVLRAFLDLPSDN